MAVRGEESLVPLADGEEAVGVLADGEVVGGVEAMPVTGLDGGSGIGSIEGGDQDVGDIFSHLRASQVEVALTFQTHLGLLLKSAEAVPQFETALGRGVAEDRVREVGIKAECGYLLVGHCQDDLSTCNRLLYDVTEVCVVTA